MSSPTPPVPTTTFETILSDIDTVLTIISTGAGPVASLVPYGAIALAAMNAARVMVEQAEKALSSAGDPTDAEWANLDSQEQAAHDALKAILGG